MIRVLSNVENVLPSKVSLEHLQVFTFFDGLSKSMKQRVARQMRWVSVSEGFTILEPYEPGKHVYFVLSGKVGVVNATGDGVRIQMGTVNAGQFFGELTVIDGVCEATAAIALKDGVLGMLDGAAFSSLATKHEQAANVLHQKLVERVRFAEDRLVAMCRYTAEQRVCLELARRMEPDPANSTRRRIFPVPIQTEIAETICTTRQTVARAFGRLIKDKVIERHGRTLLVLDHKKLEKVAFERKAA